MDSAHSCSRSLLISAAAAADDDGDIGDNGEVGDGDVLDLACDDDAEVVERRASDKESE